MEAALKAKEEELRKKEEVWTYSNSMSTAANVY